MKARSTEQAPEALAAPGTRQVPRAGGPPTGEPASAPGAPGAPAYGTPGTPSAPGSRPAAVRPRGDEAPSPAAPPDSAFELSTREFRLMCFLATRGLTMDGFRRLVRLRARYRQPRAQALDGFVVDTHMRFARWLVDHGYVTDGE